MTRPTRINFKHLRYFSEVARLGSVTAAARALYVAPQTVSAQVRELEQSIGQPLFERLGRRLVLTTAGETALDYANAIFALGDELGTVLRGGAGSRSVTLRVGVTDSVPKLMTVAVLRPVLARHRRTLELVCVEGGYPELLGKVAAGELDLVLADAPVPPSLSGSVHVRAVAESGLSFLATRAVASRLARGFPASLDDAPFIAGAAPGSLLGQAIEAWFTRRRVRPRIVGRIEDSALLKAFAQQGLGVIAVPQSIEREVVRQFDLQLVGRTDEVRQSMFLVRGRRRRPHPYVTELESAAHP